MAGECVAAFRWLTLEAEAMPRFGLQGFFHHTSLDYVYHSLHAVPSRNKWRTTFFGFTPEISLPIDDEQDIQRRHGMNKHSKLGSTVFMVYW